MFRFEHPEYFFAFAVIPLLIAVYFAWQFLRRRAFRRFATRGALERLMADRSAYLEVLRNSMLMLAFALLCVALVNPQWGTRRETVQARAADIFLALDISNSMLAQDIAPNRLERAKRFAQNVVQRFRGDRIGLILFAGSAYLQMPLTSDYASAELFIRSAHPGLAATQGTAIGEAIDLAMRAHDPEDARHKALVIITDGENHEEGAIESMNTAAGDGLIPFIVAVGTEEGGFIPMSVGNREDYKRDDSGNPVRTSVNVEFLHELADAGEGSLYQIFDGEAILDDMQTKIQSLEKRDVERRSFKDYDSYFQYFLFPAILLFIGTMVAGNRKRRNEDV